MPSLQRVLFWGVIALLLAATGCATPGAPQPPSLRLPQPVDNLSGERKGTRVVLTWTQPTRTTDKQNIRQAGLTQICRAIGEFPMSGCREVVRQLTPAEMTSQSSGPVSNPKVIYEDVLPQQVIGSQDFASYAIEVLNSRGKSAGLSNQVRIPLAPTLSPPADLRIEVTPSGPVLHWTGISRSQLGPAWQPYQFSYRLYRRLPGQPNYFLIGSVPLDGPQYTAPDNNFQWEKTYQYKIAPVTDIPASGRQSIEIEGDDSAVVTATVHDVFPPARPTGLQAVSSGVGRKPFIDLTWAPNMESDLAGYIVYRHEVGQSPVVALDQELIKAPAYRDETVEPGHTYWYSVQAVDVRGNKSQPSDETSETVPKEQQ